MVEYFMNPYKMWKRGLPEKGKCDYTEITENVTGNITENITSNVYILLYSILGGKKMKNLQSLK